MTKSSKSSKSSKSKPQTPSFQTIYKASEGVFQSLVKKEYTNFKECSKKHCKNEFDNKMKVIEDNFQGYMKDTIDEIKKIKSKNATKYKVDQTRPMADLMKDPQGKKYFNKTMKDIKKITKKNTKKLSKQFKPQTKQLSVCHQKNCKTQKRAFDKSLRRVKKSKVTKQLSQLKL